MRILFYSKNKLLRVLGVLVTFHFVCYAWVYFKAADFEQANILLGQIFNNFGADTFVPMMEGYAPVMVVLGIGYLLHFTPKFIEERTQLLVSRVPFMVRLGLILGMLWLVIQVKQAEQVMPIYLQF